MKFSVVVNMGRLDGSQGIKEIAAEALELVQIADQGGFDAAWTAEHHTIELTVSPNPFQLLAYWGAQTRRIRLGTGVVAAPYWNPIRLAGEAALCDILTGGRLELGLGRGAYQYEFDRMAGGMDQREGGRHLREIIPAVQALWSGDYAHDGELWQFPETACVPRPLQKFPPMWVAARDENTFRFAVENGCNVMSTALRKPFGEVEDLQRKFNEATANLPAGKRPEHATMRLACVYEDDAGREAAVNGAINFGRNFENLFKGIGEVRHGYPEPVDFEIVANRDEYRPEALCENMLFGTPEEIIAKIERYREAGVDHLLIGATFFMPHKVARRSLELFCDKVLPHFRGEDAGHAQHEAAPVAVGSGA
ncbi:LLM class flavin-dependent oxidoreductase [Roseovarius spongiae]|uniref:LLM class flavin-dependent oxidoreductase n=1 Tax=Roseovarius spongiae TaxID=2320272 RepID=A0A3A8AQG8_9RHOB|nr:LLM class flavin-dependent oxidoreductase [Roseovarius spongiae]RKF12572.1 LLM class flavin-dependent oxidoreductase [Roseovarius spongiae]